MTILTLFAALFGISLLIFFHELGHYFAARWVGMRVEVFSVGFGKAIFSWDHKGVKWQIGALPFGGFVKIAGTDGTEQDPYAVPDGYFGRGPYRRILVALAGPVANIIVAFIAFGALFFLGGIQKPFAELTNIIGAVDKSSELYIRGVKPGDVITQFGDEENPTFHQIIAESILDRNEIEIKGFKISYAHGQKAPFSYLVTPKKESGAIPSVGILSPARFMIYKGSEEKELPVIQAGLQPGDRIVWVDGQLVFSMQQLSDIINDDDVILKIQRGKQLFFAKVPRVRVADLKVSSDVVAEIEDWKYEAKLSEPTKQLQYIPYAISKNLTVVKVYPFVNASAEDDRPSEETTSPLAVEKVLKVGDKILSVDGIRVNSAYQFLSAVQTKRIQIIVGSAPTLDEALYLPPKNPFYQTLERTDLKKIVGSLGRVQEIRHAGGYRALLPVEPKKLTELPLSAALKKRYQEKEKLLESSIEKEENPEIRQELVKQLESLQKMKFLGVQFDDINLMYNPGPLHMMVSSTKEIGVNLRNLVTGALSPKYLSGPVGIVSVLQMSWSKGIADGLYWIGLISVNLALFNLLPIPVLDGGHIIFALFEAITGKKIRPKTMERLVFPFILLFLLFMLFATMQDISRLF